MNLSPGSVLVIILVVAAANILVALAVVARSRQQRARQYAEVDTLLSTSTWDQRSWEDEPEPVETWLPSAERWPTAQQQLSGSSDGWPAGGALGAAGARRADPADRVMAPFEFPPPTPLEQRSATRDDAGALDPDQEYEPDDEEADDDEDDVDVNGTEMLSDAADADEVEDEDQDAADQPEPEPEASPANVTGTGTSSTPFGRDGLTGLLDATAFDEAMSHEEAREQRYGHPATVIVFELDGLAKLVDRLGPEPGDRIETALGDAIKRLARRADYVARLERGRYAALLPETDEVAAINYVERIRRACDLWLESGAIAMRLAIGWASTNGDAGLTGAVRIATDRMRAELRRNARGVGDETAGVDELDGSQQAEVA